jgi:hypothetical protein
LRDEARDRIDVDTNYRRAAFGGFYDARSASDKRVED